MIGGDCDEYYGWEQQPPWGDIVPVESPPGNQQRYDDEQKAKVSERAVRPV